MITKSKTGENIGVYTYLYNNYRPIFLIFFSNSLKIVCLCFQQTQYYESNAIGESNAGAPFPFVKTGRAF